MKFFYSCGLGVHAILGQMGSPLPLHLHWIPQTASVYDSPGATPSGHLELLNSFSEKQE
jgi:hypothetical protein